MLLETCFLLGRSGICFEFLALHSRFQTSQKVPTFEAIQELGTWQHHCDPCFLRHQTGFCGRAAVMCPVVLGRDWHGKLTRHNLPQMENAIEISVVSFQFVWGFMPPNQIKIDSYGRCGQAPANQTPVLEFNVFNQFNVLHRFNLLKCRSTG